MSDNRHLTPEEENDGSIEKTKDFAAGIPAISSSLSQISKYMKSGDAIATMRKLNQKGGFDCPGCAWPDPDDERSALGEYCENGVKAIAEEATKRSLSPSFFTQNSIEEISKKTDFEIGKLGRIDQPYYKTENSNNYQAISWDSAFNKIARKLLALKNPDEAIFYTSGRTSNEAAFLYQLLVRKFGTNNLPDCSNMCHEASGKGLSETLGIGKGSVTLTDIHQAEVLIILGQNPGTNHPRMLSALEKCKKNGGQIITVNPIKEAGLLGFKHPQKLNGIVGSGTKLTDLYLQVNIGGDIAFLKALMICLFQLEKENGGVIDHDFIANKTAEFAAFEKDLKQHDFDQCVKASGLSASDIRQAAEMIASKKKIIACWAMGLTQHLHGVQNIREVVNLLLLKGAIGKEGAGTCPVRGHSNVQGDRTMGIWEAPPEKFLQSLDNHYSFKAPRKHGYAVVDAIQAMYENKAKVLFCMGGNLLSASPDTEYTAKAIQNVDLLVNVSTKLNRTHLIADHESIILPCKGRSERDFQNGNEQFVSVENSMGVVHQSKGVLDPFSDQLKSEVEIICDLASKLLVEESGMWEKFKINYDLIRNDIAVVIPGFEDYNKKVRIPKGFYLPNGARNGIYKTANQKANFSVNPLPDRKLQEDELVLMTIRSHDQFNTTIYGNDDRYRGVKNMRRIVMMNKEDMKELELKEMDKIDLTSTFNSEKRTAPNFKVVPYDIPSGNLAAYFPETNILVNINSYDKVSKTPASKFIKVKISRAK